MAVLWQSSLVPWLDASGDPYSGAEAYFFDVGTTTPQITYTDAALSIPHDHPVEADASGSFPAIFFPDESSHHLRIKTSAGVTLHDVDNISVPTTTPPEFPDSETDPEFLFQTGDVKMAWRTSSPTGWVRANGRTIGAAASGATERANADCEDLFIHLWDTDANLAVSGGRGGTSAGDWAANKTIVLPDFRGRVPGGLDSMGNSAAGRITDAVLGTDSDTLGGAGGAQTHALTEGELAAHDHPINITDAGHFHYEFADVEVSSGDLVNTQQVANTGGVDANERYDMRPTATAATVGRSSTATTGITADSDDAGSGTAHNNVQPTVLLTFFIKL